jgi:osmotically inducible protein OsmC
MRRTASAVWEDGAAGGHGTLSTETGVLDHAYYARRPYTAQNATDADELMAAANAVCFSIALADELASMGLLAKRIDITTTVTSRRVRVGWRVTGIDLAVIAQVPEATPAEFILAAMTAKLTCAICRLLHMNISMTASLQPTT